eukprot:Gb_31516 [translate_table: standard]
MDSHDRLRYGREPAPSSITRRPRSDYEDYSREREFAPYGSRMEGRNLLSAGRERELDPYGAPRLEGWELLSSGRERELDSYRTPLIDGQDLLSSGRERQLDSYRTRMEGHELLTSGREHEHKLDPYRTRMEGRDLVSLGREREHDPYGPLRTEERDLLSLSRGREHDLYVAPRIEGRYDDRDIHGGWKVRDPLVGGRDSLRGRKQTINGAGGMPSTDLRGMGLGMGSSRVPSASIGDRAMVGPGSRLDEGLGGRQGPNGRNGLSRDAEAIHGGTDSATELTVFVDGLPPDCTHREAAHIFRPFIGFKEVRIVHKEPRRPGGEKLVLCFVEFDDARHAATALEALQGYKVDERDPQSAILRISFARYPGPKGSAYHDEPRGGREFDRDYYRTRSGRR